MFRRILVPLDGSAHAEHVLSDAARLARASGGTIILVRVIRPLIEYETARLSPGTWLPAADSAMRDAASAYLAELQQNDLLQGVSTEAHILVGPVAHMIAQTAAMQHADIIIMSSRARRGLSRWVLGSVAGAVVREARVPVLVRRDTAGPVGLSLDADQAFSALVALDGSPLAEAALAPAVQLVATMSQPSGGSVHLLRVVEPQPDHATEQSLTTRLERAESRRAIRRELRNAREYLDATATQLRERTADALGVSVTWSIGRGHDVAEVLLHSAQATHDATGSGAPHGPDVIAMGTHGRGGLKRWLMGGVTESVLHNTMVPMLIVRPRDLDGRARPSSGELLPASDIRQLSSL